jgi:hypothetical protein
LNFQTELASAGFQLSRVADPSLVFDEYFSMLQRGLLSADQERELYDYLSRDEVQLVLNRLEPLSPYDGFARTATRTL